MGASNAVGLPDGFVLDNPAPTGLPDGFVLDGSAPVTAGGLAKAAGTGVVRGVEGLAGLPGDVGSGVDFLIDKAYGAEHPYIRDALKTAFRAAVPFVGTPNSKQITDAETAVTGGLHQAGNKAEQITENVASFLPGAVGGPETLAANVIKRGLVPGLVSEALGQATEGTAAEPYARMAGALVAPGVKRAPVVSSEDLINAGGNSFNAVRDTPFTVEGSATKRFANNVVQDFADRNFDLTPDGSMGATSRVLSDFGNKSLTTGQDYDALVKRLRLVGDSPANEAVGRLHDHVQGLSPGDVFAGDLGGFKNNWNNAYGNYAAGKAADTFESIAKKATDQASSANSGLNSGNKLRAAFTGAVNDAKKTRGLTDAEVAQMQKIVDGTAIGNAKRYVANTLGGGGGIGGLVAGRIVGGLAGAGAGYEADGGRGAVEGGALGVSSMLLANLLRRSYNRSVTNQAARLSEMIRARSPMALAAAPAPSVSVSPGVQRLLNMSHALQLAHGS
jgi:hypothetical protein